MVGVEYREGEKEVLSDSLYYRHDSQERDRN